MASLEKRDDGWRVRWRDPDGTPRSRQCPTKGAAQKLKAEVEECCALGRRWEPRDAREVPDLRRLLRDYAEECARVLKPNTAIRYARALDLFLRYLDRVHGKTAALPPSLLTRRLLADWYADLQHGGLHGRDRSDATRRKTQRKGARPRRHVALPRAGRACSFASLERSRSAGAARRQRSMGTEGCR